MIKIIAVSDIEINLKNSDNEYFDILISCGDLSPGYLDYLANEFRTPITIMVHGNHDKKYYKNEIEYENIVSFSEIFKGCLIINSGILNLKKYINKDLIISGYSGALSYGSKPFHFKEKDVNQLKRKIKRKLFFEKKKNIDIFISHTAPYIEKTISKYDRFHEPSKNFGKIYENYFPLLWLYGHIHRNYEYQEFDFKIEKNNEISFLINSSPYKIIYYNEKNKKIEEIKMKKSISLKKVFYNKR